MGKKVLIVEDQPESLQLLEDLLEAFHPYGVRVFTARDGKEALEIATREQVDLVLLDIVMPGMTGFDICKGIKADPEMADCYVIMVSSKTEQADRRQAALMGADEYLTKPFDIMHVLERVGLALNIKPV
ncbi:MAG: response regulator [Anaerolineae bacterium]|nr:response regulator [Anaerolineae bacterium]